MMVLVATFVFLQRRQPKLAIKSWLVALILSFLGHLSWYVASSNGPWYVPAHTFRLCADLLAGAVLLIFSGSPVHINFKRSLILACNITALFAVEIFYGSDVFHPLPYLICCAVGSVVFVGVAIWLRRGILIPTLQVLFMASIAMFAWWGNFRAAAYWCLGTIYLAAAFHTWPRLRETPLGRAAIATSLVIWAASFYAHPWLLYSGRFRQAAEQVWSMQKFFICIGMLVALLESEIKENQRLARQDQLTGLANRREMERYLLAAVESGEAQVLLLDLNGFKEVNDALGHQAGDELLCEVAKRIQQLLGDGEILARVGGDEFVAVSRVPNHSMAQEISRVLVKPIFLEGTEVQIGVSIGKALFPEDAAGLNGKAAVLGLLKSADQSMYSQKRQNPGRRRTDPKTV